MKVATSLSCETENTRNQLYLMVKHPAEVVTCTTDNRILVDFLQSDQDTFHIVVSMEYLLLVLFIRDKSVSILVQLEII